MIGDVGPWDRPPGLARDRRLGTLQEAALEGARGVWETFTDPADEFQPMLLMADAAGTATIAHLVDALAPAVRDDTFARVLPELFRARGVAAYVVVLEVVLTAGDGDAFEHLVIVGGTRSDVACWSRPILRGEAGRPGIGEWSLAVWDGPVVDLRHACAPV